jgi:hypothetical protein
MARYMFWKDSAPTNEPTKKPIHHGRNYSTVNGSRRDAKVQ